MPRTRSTKGEDKQTPEEKLLKINSKIELSIFFNYYDGFNTNGMAGFSVDAQPGSTKHHGENTIYSVALTKDQF